MNKPNSLVPDTMNQKIRFLKFRNSLLTDRNAMLISTHNELQKLRLFKSRQINPLVDLGCLWQSSEARDTLQSIFMLGGQERHSDEHLRHISQKERIR